MIRNMITSQESGARSRREIDVDVHDDDLYALTRLLAEVAVVRSETHRDQALDEVIAKPWGWECRVFADHLVDVWMLRIEAGERTSLHAHLKKRTHLLCLSGEGTARSMRDEWAIEPGMIVNIAPGAFHSTHASNGPLVVIEVENPRNKLDLVRLEDAYARSATLYEANPVATEACRLVAVPHSAGARMRHCSPDDRFRFDLFRASDLPRRSGFGDAFHVPVGVEALRVGRRPTGAELPALREAEPDSRGEYLAIRPKPAVGLDSIERSNDVAEPSIRVD